MNILTDIDIFQADLDNLMAEMNNILSSRYLGGLRKEAEELGTQIMDVMEILEDVLVVQKNWMYLVGIFSGGDIKSHLPVQYDMFTEASTNFKLKMKRFG